MEPPTEPSADLIAGDLGLAICQGLIRPGERVPSQTKLMSAYGVAMGTAASALAKLAAVGLTHGRPGAGTFAADIEHLPFGSPVLDVLDAARLCRTLAATSFTQDPVLHWGGSPDYDDPHVDPDRVRPPRRLDVSALHALDRHLLRWQAEAFTSAARRIIAAGGECPADRHLLAAARSIVRSGGRRPDGQAPVAQLGGPVPADEDFVLRIWPERRASVLPQGAAGGGYSAEPPF